MIEQIKCCECEKSENCNRVAEYCWHEVELYAEKVKAEAFEKFLDKAEALLCENLIFQQVEDIISSVLEEDK